jgi:chromosome segregation ATPase
MIWKTPEKNNEIETQNTMEHHSSRLEQVKDRISELYDKMEIKGKTEELLVKQLKTCERNVQELTDSIKRTNLKIMDIEGGEEVQAKEICNIFMDVLKCLFSLFYNNFVIISLHVVFLLEV